MADAVLQYDFAVVNANAVDRAFAAIERRAAAHNRRMQSMFGTTRGASQRGTVAGAGGAATVRAGSAAGISDEAKALRYRMRLRERYEREGLRRTERIKRQEAAEVRRAEREKTRIEEREARTRARNQDKYNRALSRQRKADLAHAQRTRKAAEREVAREGRERARTARGLAGVGMASAGSSLRAVGGMAAGALALGGSLGASVAVSQQITETKLASQLANQAGTPGAKGEILKEAQSIRGFTGEEALRGMGAFMDLTGDLDMARRLMKELAQLTNATGSEFDDILSAAGNFSNVLKGITDKEERAKAIGEVMRALAGQGLAGAVEIKDLAGGGAIVGAAAQAMSNPDMAYNIKAAGVLAQAAKAEGGAATADEALRAVQRFMDFSAIGGAGERLKDLKIKTLEGGKVRDPVEIISDYYEKMKGQGFAKSTEAFGQMGGRVVRGFGAAFERGGRAGVRARFNELMGQELSAPEIAVRAESRLSDPDLQFKEAMKSFNAKVGSELLPVVTDLIPVMERLIDPTVEVVKAFSILARMVLESPLSTIGSMIATKVGLDIAQAQIGNAMVKALEKGSEKGSFKFSNAAFTGASLGAVTAGVIYTTGVAEFEAKEQAIDEMGKLLNELRAGAANGMTREEGRARLQQMKEIGQERVDPTSMFERIAGGAASLGIKGAMFAADLASAGSASSIARSAGLTDEKIEQISQGYSVSASGGQVQRNTSDSFVREADRLVGAMKRAADSMEMAFSSPNRGSDPIVRQ